jgi:uncharacterized protein YbjT (DUF2867 family)
MHVVFGATGNTGSAVATALLDAAQAVRVVVRVAQRAAAWPARGAEVVAADLADWPSVARAFAGAAAAYVLNPPAYCEPDLFERAERVAASIARAARAARLPRRVVLSSMGAHLGAGSGIIATNRRFEQVLVDAARAVTFVRPAYFMQNWSWVADVAARDGVLPSFLGPTARAIAMVSTEDVGRMAAALMLDGRGAEAVVELEGPCACSPDDAARAFAHALGRPVKAVAVPRPDWPRALEASRFAPRTIEAWSEMFDGFNSGSIGFERPAAVRRGRVRMEEASAGMARRA